MRKEKDFNDCKSQNIGGLLFDSPATTARLATTTSAVISFIVSLWISICFKITLYGICFVVCGSGIVFYEHIICSCWCSYDKVFSHGVCDCVRYNMPGSHYRALIYYDRV